MLAGRRYRKSMPARNILLAYARRQASHARYHSSAPTAKAPEYEDAIYI